MPTFQNEDEQQGIVLGVDEVGRGPLAGPVVAASVYVPKEIRAHPFISDIRDSKKLSKPKLKILNALIHEFCIVSIAECSPQEIDKHNILKASLYAMKRSIENINITPDFALIDGNKIPMDLSIRAKSIVKGDSISKSIAAASIVAKFYRDKVMEDLSFEFPHYGWERNVGYPTEQHRNAINKYGITPHHRKSFSPVRNYMESIIKNVS
jgi:ribonuclease HII